MMLAQHAAGRRAFLKCTAAFGAAAAVPSLIAHEQATARSLQARPSSIPLVGAEHPRTAVWSYEGGVPGPALRYRQGETLRVELENLLPADTSVHWHGVRVPNAMDGVPGLTQPPVRANGGRFAYEFRLPDAGTYWYHPHLGSPEQVGRGLYGALIVEEREPPAVDRDVVWMLGDWRLDGGARIVEDFGSLMDASHAGRIGNTVTVNGAVTDAFELRSGERVRLRLVNAANARVFALDFRGHEPLVIALDGQPVEPHRPERGRVVLGPSMRADVLLDATAAPGSAHTVADDFYPRRAYRLLDLRYAAKRVAGHAGAPPPRLAPNPLAEPDLASAQRHSVRFEGGMMGGMPMDRMRGGTVWLVNGKAAGEHHHHAEAPLFTLGHGRSHVVELVNDTAWHHPIHLHGHVFRVLSRDGRPAARREWLDTVLLDPRSRAEIAFVADNPGKWMFHCHVLEHQVSGMSAVIEVA